MVFKMRFETLGSIGKFGVLVILILSFRPWEARKAPCQEEIALVDHWTSANLIRTAKQSGKNFDVFVDDKAWAALPRSTQLEISNAVYCRVALAGEGGIARIDDLSGKELARVANGNWYSQQFPE